MTSLNFKNVQGRGVSFSLAIVTSVTSIIEHLSRLVLTKKTLTPVTC